MLSRSETHFKSVLIIGGYGFVGRNLVAQLLKDPSTKICIVDNFLSSDRHLLAPDERISVVEGDASDFKVFDEIPVSVSEIYILNCLHGNQSSLYDPLSDLQNTLAPVVTTLEWVRKNRIQARIVYAGAGCAVAEKTWDSAKAVVESDIVSLNHDSPYSISKIAGEMHCIMFARQFGLNIMRARFQNVYGPGEVLGAGQWRGTDATIWRNVTPTFIWKALHGEELKVTGENAARDFIYVKDLVRGLEAIMQSGVVGEAYNLASGIETTITSWAKEIITLSSSKSNLVIDTARQWDNSGRRFGDPTKSQAELNFVAQIEKHEGLRETIDWTIENQELIGKSIQKHDKRNFPLIGIVYSPHDLYTNTVREHVEGFLELKKFEIVFIPSTDLPDKNLNDFDGIINHYSIRLAFPETLPQSYLSMLKEYKGKKIIFIQDEYDNTERVRKIFEEIKPDIVFTCVPSENIETIYPKNRFPRTTFQNILTGFAYLPGEVEAYGKPFDQRTIDIGYRGRFIGNRYGELGFQKWWIGEKAKQLLSMQNEFSFDISSEESMRIYGVDWLIYLGNCKATLGSASGSNVFDFNGEIRILGTKNANMPYEIFSRSFLQGRELDGLMDQISPRIFEAAAVKTLLILFEGRYSDALVPWVHYLPLKKDFSNFDELLTILKDNEKVDEITTAAYHHLILSKIYSKETYYRNIETKMEPLFNDVKITDRKSVKYPSSLNHQGFEFLTAKTMWFDENFPMKKIMKIFWRLIPIEMRFKVLRYFKYGVKQK